MKIDNVQIRVSTKDSEDDKYCAIVLGYNDSSYTWFNTGIVIRENTPQLAFDKALARAIENGWWK